MSRAVLRLLAAAALANALFLFFGPDLFQYRSFWVSTTGQLAAGAKTILAGAALLYGARDARFATVLRTHGALCAAIGLVYFILPHAQWQGFAQFLFDDYFATPAVLPGAGLVCMALSVFWLHAARGPTGTSGLLMASKPA
ncbi:MAG TPA: hypothetical protein DFR83_00970 [Deltaproteobacteria bacterium]|nr:hypothetical protein [Deltaproteobacteria bacterium]